MGGFEYGYVKAGLGIKEYGGFGSPGSNVTKFTATVIVVQPDSSSRSPTPNNTSSFGLFQRSAVVLSTVNTIEYPYFSFPSISTRDGRDG